MRFRRATVVCVLVLAWLSHNAAGQPAQPSGEAGASRVLANDNRRASGTLADGILTLRLVAEQGAWQPEGPAGRTLSVQAFREEAGPLSVPGPLVRVPAGTDLRVSVRNNLGATLRVFALQRPAADGYAPLEVRAGETREARFRVGEPGTYYYWASTTGRSLAERGAMDAQLGGAFVVDPPDARVDDRIFVVGLWRKPGTAPGEIIEFGIVNGHSWPASEPLAYRMGDTVRWRVINLSVDQHAMHLHGMYFKVLAHGNGRTSTAHSQGEQPLVVTEHMDLGETFEMEWTPERPGNWLFHCHMLQRMSPDRESPLTAAHQHGSDASGGMAGMVVGIKVAGTASETAPPRPARRFTLRLREEPNRYGDRLGYRIDAEGLETSRLAPGPIPGPTLVLTRGEPVEVEIANELGDPTAIHWHGIELDRYFDGVPGWGGTVGSTTPQIDAGQRCTARFTPPCRHVHLSHALAR